MKSRNNPGKIPIVLVDDHEIFRDGIELIVDTLANMQVVKSTSDPYAILSDISALKGSIYLMDISMPAMSGIELSRKIRKEDHNARIILLTSNADIQHIKLGISAGISGYLTKNVAKEELSTAIVTVFSGSRYFSKDLSQELLAQLTQYVINDTSSSALTERELDVLREIANGLTYQEIADRLVISVKTVEAHRSNILKKTGLKNNADLVKQAIKLKLIDLN